MILLADSESPDQPAHLRRLIWTFAVRVCPKTRFPWHGFYESSIFILTRVKIGGLGSGHSLKMGAFETAFTDHEGGGGREGASQKKR